MAVRYYKCMRVGTAATTLHKIYRCRDGTIINDRGGAMMPNLKNEMWWKRIKITGWEDQYERILTETETAEEPKENDMCAAKVDVKQTTLVNGVDVDNLSDQEIMDTIGKVQAKLKQLSEVGYPSKFIDAEIVKHGKNRDELIALLDARVPEATDA